MALIPTTEQREVTPEERRRSARTFWFILLIFPSIIGLMITFLSLQGRQLRSYTKDVMLAAQAHPPVSTVPCVELVSPLPPSVHSCIVEKKSDESGKDALYLQIILNNNSKYEGSEPLQSP